MLEPNNTNEGTERPGLGREAARADTGAPLADREVPLPGSDAFGSTPAAVHAWLDGEATEADARAADAKQVALWSRIADETSARRRMTTPSYVQQRIMDALPAARPAVASVSGVSAATTATVNRIALTPISAALAAAGFIALGFLLARFLA